MSFPAAHLPYRSDVLVLCYHAVSREWDAALSVTPERLESQLSHLRARGYRAMRFSEAVLGRARGRVVAVTFDDGYRSVLTHAKPILDRLGWPATLFVPTDYVGSDEPMSWPGIDQWVGGPFEQELMPLSWSELRALQEAGWEIGSHTCSHPHLTRLGDTQLRSELANAKGVCERELGGPCASLAYPYGDVDDRVVAAARAVGYHTGAALPERHHDPHPLRWPRVGVYFADDDRRFLRKQSRALRLLQRTLLWTPARAATRWAAAVLRPAGTLEDGVPALRLAARRGALLRARPLAMAVGLAGRLGVSDVHVLWPQARAPLLVMPPGAPDTVAWMTVRFEPSPRRGGRLHAATRAALRARAAFIGTGSGLAVDAAEAALGHALAKPRVALCRASTSAWVKVLAFVWHAGEPEPAVVVKLMPDPRHERRLRHETEVVAVLRERLTGSPACAALPLAPLLVGEREGRYVVVDPVDPLGGFHQTPGRERALEWLGAFHAATAREARWTEGDEQAALAMTARTWEAAKLQAAPAVGRRVEVLLAELRGAPMASVAVHGDFWRGNMAFNGIDLRVYDWEWTRLEGNPCFDLWSYEFAELRVSTPGRAGEDLSALAASLRRIEEELGRRAIDPAFALPLLAPTIGELTFRNQWLTGEPLEREREVEIMRAASELILRGRAE